MSKVCRDCGNFTHDASICPYCGGDEIGEEEDDYGEDYDEDEIDDGDLEDFGEARNARREGCI